MSYKPKNLLVTGGAGFIGANYIQWLLNERPDVYIVNLDLLTYAGNLENLNNLPSPDRHTFIEGDINDGSLVERLRRPADQVTGTTL